LILKVSFLNFGTETTGRVVFWAKARSEKNMNRDVKGIFVMDKL